MTKRVHVLTLAGASLLLFASADAARWGKPGLWEMSSSMNMAMGGMPTISPEQMARLKKLGVKMPAMNGSAIVSKVCVTPHDVESFDAKRYASERSGCRQASMTRTGNHIVSTVVCDGQMKGQGRADVTLTDESHYSTMFAFKGVSHGRAVDMKVSTNAHWLGADCKGLKPLTHG